MIYSFLQIIRKSVGSSFRIYAILSVVPLLYTGAFGQSVKRTVIPLNGSWEIAQGTMAAIPHADSFSHRIEVPGLVNLAIPAFENVAPKVLDRRSKIATSDPLREAFWYKRKFTIENIGFSTALLKISKAKYGTKVFLNGKEIGEHLPNFTPGYFDVGKALKQGVNELIVRVGASRAAVPRSVPDGFDFEKERYIPGIYDDVHLILAGDTYIQYIQAAPDIIRKEVLAQVMIQSSEKKTIPVSFQIKESGTGKIAGQLAQNIELSANKDNTVNIRIPIENCRLWSPEDPFLYQLTVQTGTDEKTIEFGMREFHFDQLTQVPMLNGKPYFLRGSNITIYRFFEDPLCKNLPWDTTWVRQLFRSFKQFHWNSLRFCIGLPPAFWYQVADEEGFLIQDEFPIWYGGKGWNVWPDELKRDQLALEFSEWLHENQNHPSVVIWDASNENVSHNGLTDEVGDAAWQVRYQDLSNRPWDNSYGLRRAPGDVYESHPYHFIRSDFKLKDIANSSTIPKGNPDENLQNFPVIINEYGWLWLNRDGTPTTLTQAVYENLLGPTSTTEQRWHLYATYMAAETEFWRCHRNAAGVLIFTALGYSRPDGQTSDFFTDIRNLKYHPEVLKYFPDAFSPVGIMLDEWGQEIKTNTNHSFRVIAVNDLYSEWKGTVSIKIFKDDKLITEKSATIAIPDYGKKNLIINCRTPANSGKYNIEAVLTRKGDKPVRSLREDIRFSD